MPVSSRDCPACGERAIRVVDYPEGRISLCPNCHLGWAKRAVEPVNGQGTLATLNHRYMDPRAMDPATYEPFVAFFRTLAGRAEGRELRLLDVGCGNGSFLAEAAGRGFAIAGIELDQRLREVIPPEVVAHVVFDYAEAAVPRMNQTFDVVTFWDSFEHMDDPFAVLESLRPSLAPGARVFIRVNNSHDVFNLATRLSLAVAPDSLGRRMLKACFNLPDHAWNFSVPAMSRMLKRHGWRLVDANVTETPATRLTASPVLRLAFNLAYAFNRLIGGGKIGQYWIEPDA